MHNYDARSRYSREGCHRASLVHSRPLTIATASTGGSDGTTCTRDAVSGGHLDPSCTRSMLTESCLCHACSCHEVWRTETPAQVRGLSYRATCDVGE
jgi:hypothetical protein